MSLVAFGKTFIKPFPFSAVQKPSENSFSPRQRVHFYSQNILARKYMAGGLGLRKIVAFVAILSHPFVLHTRLRTANWQHIGILSVANNGFANNAQKQKISVSLSVRAYWYYRWWWCFYSSFASLFCIFGTTNAMRYSTLLVMLQFSIFTMPRIFPHSIRYFFLLYILTLRRLRFLCIFFLYLIFPIRKCYDVGVRLSSNSYLNTRNAFALQSQIWRKHRN